MWKTIEWGKNVNKAWLEQVARKEFAAITELFQIMWASPEKCEEIKNYLLTCLAEVRDDRVNSIEPVNEDRTTVNNNIDQGKEIYHNNFKENIKWIRNPDKMIRLLEELEKNWKLTTTKKSYWRIISLDCLDYKIIIRNLWDVNFKSYNITKRENRTDFSGQNTFETNKRGMMKISNEFSKWRVASKKDIQNILRTLSKKYSLKSGKQFDIHDEDIAFFMLITECYGDFLLKDSVFKCYDNFRWFKEIRNDWTGQIILLMKK